jgi:hypothetical protein
LPFENVITIESKRVRWSENVARRKEFRNLCTNLVGKPEQKRPSNKSTNQMHQFLDLLPVVCGKIETNEMGRACGAYGEE